MNQKLVESIKNQTLSFLCEFIKHRRPKEEFLGRANFIMKYSYNLRRLLKDDPKQIEEVSKTTRLLFEKLLEYSPKKINEIINLCFEFIILYKNTEKKSEIKKAFI